MPDRAIVTFVGEGQATVGFRFVSSQPPEVCKGCKLFKICMGKLVPGRTYQVIELKQKQHYCPLYEGNVSVAKVLQAPTEVAMKPQHAIEGATVAFAGVDCNERCPLEKLCKPEGIKRGERVRIEKVSEDISEMAVCGKRFKKASVLVVEH